MTGQVLNPTLRGYVHDMAAPYGLAVHDTLIDEGKGHSYGEMCRPLLAELVHDDDPADLLVLATAIPDVRYGRSTATYLSWHCPGAPLAFTVCDQGLLAVFTALHLIAAYQSRRAVLLAAEQPTVYHEVPVPTPMPSQAAAVGMVLTQEGPHRLTPIRRHTKLTPRQARETLAQEISGLGEPLVLAGAGLAELTENHPVDGNIVVCQEKQPLTGIWLELTHRLQDLRNPLLLAEYDPTQGHLFTTTLS